MGRGKNMRKINKIILHCTATPEGRDHSVAEIRRWHRQRDWEDIGYHFFIRLDGRIEKGRPIEKIGAHVRGYNRNSIGIVYVGGCDKKMRPKDTRTIAQKQAIIALVSMLKSQYPNATVHGHSEFSNKACPCFDVKKEFRSFNEGAKK